MKEDHENGKIPLNVGSIFGLLNCIKLAGEADKFIGWLDKEHKIKKIENIFEGYKFFLESTLRAFLHSLIYDYSLEIEEDFIFYRARFTGVELSKIPNTCQKTILIKNINEYLRLIKKSKNLKEINSAIIKFDKVLRGFWEIHEKQVVVNNKINISKNLALKYLTMFYVYIFLNDTSRHIPHGYWVSVLDNNLPKERYKKIFLGYKYALQFVWSVLLEEKYYSTSLPNLHKSKRWSAIDDLSFNLKRKIKKPLRDDLDSYFGKIQNEIIEPLEKKLGLDFGSTNLLYSENKLSQKEIKDLLKNPKETQLNEKEILDAKLFWYDIELLDSKHIFNGVPAFSSLLIGTAELKRRVGDIAYVCKFIHPDKSVKGNDFSYGVLVEAFGSSGISDYSGWVLCFDCCTDYSGFGGSEHEMAEKIIKEYQDKGWIEVIEMNIDKNKFKGYIVNRITERKRKDILDELEFETERKIKKDIVSEARGLILELVTYYYLSKKEKMVDWNIKTNKNQLDVIFTTDNNFIIIECKCNPNNVNIDKEIGKLKGKLGGYNTEKNKKCEFWFWERPSSKVINKLNSAGIEHKVLPELIKIGDIWKNKKMDKLKNIFNIKKYRDVPNK